MQKIMIDIKLIAVGAIREKYIKEGIINYEKRLKPFARVKVLEVTASSFSEKKRLEAMREEGEALASKLEKIDRHSVYLLAEDGLEYDSFQFARLLESASLEGGLVLVLGGSLGLAESIRKNYPKAISLSRLTMPHELARLVLYEQIYRSATILLGKKYHY
jgi:23S rRNA (pseudouridine1915-N3)-methyltransferase